MRKIKVGDDVMVITGKDKGKRGTVLKLVGEDKILVESVNMVKKHERPNPQKGISGGIIDREMPLSISNVGLYNPTKGRAGRGGFDTLAVSMTVRVFQSDGEVVDV